MRSAGTLGTAQGQTAGKAEAGGGSIFSRLLARLGAGLPGQDAAAPAAGEEMAVIDIPGDPATRKAALEELSDALDGLAAWAQAQMARQSGGTPTGETVAAPQGAATEGAEGSQTLDALTQGLEGVGVLAGLAERLGAILAEFDAAHGADSRAVLQANAAALPGLALSSEGGAAPVQFLAMARDLLGLAPAVNAGSAAATGATDAAPTPDVSALVRSTPDAQPGAVPTGVDPVQGKEAELFRALIDRAAAQGAGRSPEGAVQAPGQQTPPHIAGLAEPRMPVAEAPVARSEPAAPAPAQPQSQSSFAANLAGQVRGVQLHEGTTRIELAPRGLGGMEIDLSRDDNGGLRLTVRAENPAVLGALRDNRDALLAVLRDGGVTVQQGALGFEAFGDQRRGPPAPMQTTVSGEAAEAEAGAEATEPAAPRDPGEGRVDMLT